MVTAGGDAALCRRAHLSVNEERRIGRKRSRGINALRTDFREIAKAAIPAGFTAVDWQGVASKFVLNPASRRSEAQDGPVLHLDPEYAPLHRCGVRRHPGRALND